MSPAACHQTVRVTFLPAGYRAGATIDLTHDNADADQARSGPTRVLWTKQVRTSPTSFRVKVLTGALRGLLEWAEIDSTYE
jgi:hypothetical protein